MLIALTGGIGSGKTTAANLFAQLGVYVLSADQIAKELTLPGTPAYLKIVEHFGHQILHPSGIDRKLLRQIIFTDATQRLWLENLLHPLISKYIETHTAHYLQSKKAAEYNIGNDNFTTVEHTNTTTDNAHPYCLVEIPLLVENSTNFKQDRILLIDCPTEVQLARISARDHISAEEITAIMHAQATRRERLQHYDDLINNNGSLLELHAQVQALHTKYMEMIKILFHSVNNPAKL